MVQKKCDVKIDPDVFAKALEEIYQSPDEKLQVDYDKIKSIPSFDLIEMRWALGKMGNSRGADKSNIVVEMIKFAGASFQNVLLNFYNDIINHATLQENWFVTIFSMLPKSGNLECPSTWRPIAILPILYKIFAKMLYYRLYPILDAWQADDQFGLRKNKRIDDVFAIL